MTNVPPQIREIWTDLYKLFDRHFLMKNTEEDWFGFWNDAVEISKKSGNDKACNDMIIAIADFFGERMKKEYEQQFSAQEDGPGGSEEPAVSGGTGHVRDAEVEQLHI